MCRWGCQTVDTTYMCKWCGTRYCKECLRGDFHGLMKEEAVQCRVCFQPKCQGQRVEYVPRKNPPEEDKKGKRGKSASSKRGKSAKGAKTKKGKKSGKKKKK